MSPTSPHLTPPTPQTIPAVDYFEFINHKQLWLFIPDWVLAVFVALYGANTLLDITRALQHERLMARAREGEPLQTLTPGESRWGWDGRMWSFSLLATDMRIL